MTEIFAQKTASLESIQSLHVLKEDVVKNCKLGTPLVAQWLRICLPMQGTWVRALVREDSTC